MAALRKRLGNAGVDLSSAKANESFVLIGTPLPPLEKTKDSNEFVPLWKQDVRDEQGRRRLHGAFTGGFSAGYYNTVGSKEGWAPSTFKSSRTERGTKKFMRPEDFMDDEDKAELQESRKLVDEEAVTGMQDTSGLPANDNDSFSAALANILPPINESIGAQLLKKMGWRLGQGIGPRLTYEQLKRRSEQDGTPLPAVEDAEAMKHTYAPRDTKLVGVSRKDDFHGLGYVPAMGLRSSNKQATEVSGPKLSSGFGLGALNDAEDDDVDVYDDGLPSGGRRLAFEAGDDDDERIKSRKPAPISSTGPKFQSAGFFKSGVPLLSGFVIGDMPIPAAKKFEPPEVPKEWISDPNRIWGVNQEEATSNAAGPTAPSYRQWKTGISADERGSILGEEQLPAAKHSIWDYLSSKDRERLQNFKENQNAAKTISTQPAPVQVIDVPRTDPAVAKAALMGFQPFKDDSRKQARYSAYLGSQASSQPMQLQPLPGQSIADFNAELESFAKAAQIFKPMSAAMASRFRSSSGIETTAQPQEGLYQPTDEAYAEHEAKTKAAEAERMQLEETPKEHAAKMGMFGAMTREQSDWIPAKLLCKRFRVPAPKVAAADAKEDDDSNAAQSYSSSNPTPLLTAMDVDTSSAGDHIKVIPSETTGTGKRDMANIGLGEDDTQGRETLTYERPAMDIFKAIFASDEEDSDEEVEGKGASQPTEIPSAQAGPSVQAFNAHAPAQPAVAADSGPVDLTTFRPTFMARSTKAVKDASGDKAQKAKKKKVQAPISFVEEDDAGLTVVPVAKKRKRDKDPEGKDPKKKRDKESDKATAEPVMMAVDEEDDEMWVEKPVPVIQAPTATPGVGETGPTLTGKNRPRASDFL